MNVCSKKAKIMFERMLNLATLHAWHRNQISIASCDEFIMMLTTTSFLFQCDCNGNEKCLQTKTNIEQCRSEVFHATKPNTVVTCSAARWICAADPQCSVALEYYNQFCGAMFRGRRCTKRCLNSIRILKRQSAAAKLESCRCTGEEHFDCVQIKDNMERLCFRMEETNEIDDDDDAFAKRRKDHRASSALRIALEKLLLFACLFVSAFAAMLAAALDSNRATVAAAAAAAVEEGGAA
jgi:hypothetical protein